MLSTPRNQKGKGKGTGKGKGDSKGKSGSKGKYDGKSKKEVLCPFFRKNGACKKGSGCDMLHALVIGEETGRTQGVVTQQSLAMGPKPDASSLINPFAALSVTIGEYSNSEVISGGVLKTSPRTVAEVQGSRSLTICRRIGGRSSRTSPEGTSTGPW